MEPGWRQGYSVLDNVQFCKLFVGGLSPSTNDVGLRAYFGAFGSLTDCVVMINSQSNHSRCFGFITFSSVTEADRAMAASPHVLNGNQVELRWAVPREDSCKPGAHARVKKIFVGGLKGDLGESDLMKHFSQFGPVERAEIIINKQSHKKRGFGFVHFVDYDTTDKAAMVKFHPILGHQVEVKKALPKEDLDQWGFDLPIPGSGYTWRPSNRARAGFSSSRNPTPTPSPAPAPIPTPIHTPILKPPGWPGPKLAGWGDSRPPGWLGPKPPQNPDADCASKSVGDPDSKSPGGPDLKPGGDSDPKIDGSLIHTLSWIPCPKPAWMPSFGSGWGPNPKPVGGPDPKPWEGGSFNLAGESWVPEAKPGTGPVSNPVFTSEIGLQTNLVFHSGYDPKPEPNPSSGLDPRCGFGLNQGFDPQSGLGLKPRLGLGPDLKQSLLGLYPSPNLGFLGCYPSPKSGLLGFCPRPKRGLLGPGPSPNLGLGQGSGPGSWPHHPTVSQGRGDQNSRGGRYNCFSGYSRGSQSQTSYSYSHSQHQAATGPMNRRWGGWEYRGRSSRGTHRGGPAGSGGS